MAEALEAGYDLGALALCFLAIGLLLVAKEGTKAVAGIFDFSIFGFRPLHGIAVALENTVVAALDDAIKGVERATAKFESGLIDAFGMLIALPALAILGVKAALEYLWTSALKPTIHSITDTIRDTAVKALAKAVALEATVEANLAAAEEYARGKASAALASAEAYVESRLGALKTELRGDIASALAEAETFADQAVGKLRAAEDAAISEAVALAAAAKAAGIAAASAALHTAEGEIASAEQQAEAVAAGALATAEAAGNAALAVVESVAVTAEHDLKDIEGALGAAGLAALVASIPALATLVKAIATEAGLGRAECRTKVKGICGTDPTAWANLLEGLAAIGFAFSLAELAQVANGLIDGLAPIIRAAE